ncbi:DUF1674 domain-containing protein [Brucella oryzae]|uniref:DUF1674 domain-containing protein n=1 Tax=Brucella oryzae TaxID=335286 RepID=UPI001B830D2B|nr:DUF1674 domain-containing protein [Brucella oryzae]MBR7651863.1 DUF1674 domain-containing protein [Brucella oryzae]
MLPMSEKTEATESPENAGARMFEDLPPAAQRALKEAEARRLAERANEAPREIGGRGGKDPARYGDWEIKGRSIDF